MSNQDQFKISAIFERLVRSMPRGPVDLSRNPAVRATLLAVAAEMYVQRAADTDTDTDTDTKTIDFNANDYVKIQLTDVGREMIRKEYGADYDLGEDENGWVTWQLHRVMSTFGPHMFRGFDPLFKPWFKFVMGPK